VQIFEDPDCTAKIERVLWEGQRYYFQFPNIDPRTIENELSVAGLTKFVSWNKRNPIAEIKVVNQIGLFKIFGKEYDVRSKKFLEAETGDRQFRILLDDLATLSRHLIFSSTATTTARRDSKSNLFHASSIERFNYYRQACLRKGTQQGLANWIDQIVRTPKSRLIDEYERDQIWNATRPSRHTLRSVLQQNQTFARLSNQHPLAKGRPGLKASNTNEVFFPLKVMRRRGVDSPNTPENQFAKFVLTDIETVCRAVITQGLLSGSLLDQCRELLSLARSLLSIPFFREIGILQTIPFSSPTLISRHGYRDLYRVFMRSRIGAKHLFADLQEDAFAVELKDVSVLYEYWVFYKVANALLAPGALFLSKDTIVKDGRILGACSVSDGKWIVHFNKSFSRNQGSSYSLRLRPDVVIERVATEQPDTTMFVLDAKYRNVQSLTDIGDEDALAEVSSEAKSADIHKMHTYIDAIESVKVALAVYPGNEFTFFPRNVLDALVSEPQEIKTLSGVGALPLLPGTDNKDLLEFIKRIDCENAQKVS
jgi:uncharacterized protein